MKAVILAGGRGKRLRPVTDYVPKPLVPINNAPIIEWQIGYLRGSGIRDIIVCTGYKSEMISDFLDRRGIRGVVVSREGTPLGTGGAVRKVAPMITGKAFLVMNGDVVTDMDLGRLARAPNSVATIPLRTKFGIMDVSGGRVAGFREKGSVPGTWMNAGVYCLERGSLADMPRKGDLEKTLFPDYASRGMLNAVEFPDAMWHSIDSFKDVEECSADLAGREP